MVRAVYDPAMREAIERGELDEMKRLLGEAKALYRDQGDLKVAIGKLERAIKRLS